MTRKNAAKGAARARQDRFGGKYLHHRRLKAGGPTEPPEWNKKLTMETVVALAHRNAPSAIANAGAQFGEAAFVFVVGDASEPLGRTIAAACNAAAEGVSFQAAADEIKVEVARRHARNDNMPFGGLLRVDDLASILHRTSPPEQIHAVVELIARFSTPPPKGHTHVFAIAAGEVMATLVPLVRMCLCGHPLTEHDDKGACMFFGVPEGPMQGLPEPLAAHARALGVPMKCPCRGVAFYDASGRRLPD